MTVNQVKELAGHFIIQRGSTSPQPAVYGRLQANKYYIFIYNICIHAHASQDLDMTLLNAESVVWTEYGICMDTAACSTTTGFKTGRAVMPGMSMKKSCKEVLRAQPCIAP